jgi:hypothetical protein
MTNRICQFAKNRTDIKIIKFGPQSEFCKSLQELLDGRTCEVNVLFTILEGGVIGRNGNPQIFPLHDFCVGEPIIYTFTTIDQEKTASLSVIPYPFEKKDDKGHKISVELRNPQATFFMFLAEGFNPSETLTINSQSENEQMTFEAKASEKGVLESFCLPEVIGKKKGIASIEVIGKNTALKLTYPWGELIPAGSPQDQYFNQ